MALAVLEGHVFSWFLKLILHCLMSLSDIYVIYFIHMQAEGTVARKRKYCMPWTWLILDLSRKLLQVLVFLSKSFSFLSVFVLEPLLMYSYYYSIFQLVWIFMLVEYVVPVIKMLACSDRVRIFFILAVFVQSYLTSLHSIFCRATIRRKFVSYILNFYFVCVLSNGFGCNYLLVWEVFWCIA